jgi:hypothetical protein
MEEIALVVLLLLLTVLFYLASRVRAGKAGELRPMPGLEELPGLVGRSAETGQPLHVSVGVAGVGGATTAETWAGLSVLETLADEAAACGTPLTITVADATVLPIAQDVLWRAYARNGNPEGYDPTQVQLVSPDAMAYAAGVTGILEREALTANVMIGTFGDEYLLMGETGARRGVRQIVGAADPRTLTFVYARRQPIQVASLLAEDWARWAVAAGILVIAVLKIVL